MKRFLTPLALVALIFSSCDNEVSDSYSTATFAEYNLITDLDNPNEPAQVSGAFYELKLNFTKSCIDVKTSDLILNNQKFSFTTDTMAYNSAYLVLENGSYIQMGYFSKQGEVGKDSDVSDLSAYFTQGVYNVSDLYIPGVESTASGLGMRLVMNYDLNNKYHVQTFWPLCYYMGQTNVFGTETISTYKTAYRVELDFTKKTSRVVIYYPEYSKDNTDTPKAIVLEEVPIILGPKSYTLYAEAPTTKILGLNDKGVQALISSDKYQVENFALELTDTELTDALITYKIDGKSVMFDGSSIAKAKKQ